MRCESCGVVLTRHDMKDIEIETSSGVISIPETFCSSCLKNYVYMVDDLEDRFYQHETLTEIGYLGFRKYKE